jgi:hypothetical protein
MVRCWININEYVYDIQYIRRSRVQDPAAADFIFLLALGMEIMKYTLENIFYLEYYTICIVYALRIPLKYILIFSNLFMLATNQSQPISLWISQSAIQTYVSPFPSTRKF